MYARRTIKTASFSVSSVARASATSALSLKLQEHPSTPATI